VNAGGDSDPGAILSTPGPVMLDAIGSFLADPLSVAAAGIDAERQFLPSGSPRTTAEPLAVQEKDK